MSEPSQKPRRLLGARRLVLLGALLVLPPSAGYLAYRHRPALLAGSTSIRDHPLRRAYEREVAALADRAAALRREGGADEEIARILHGERRAIGKRYKDLTPEPLRSRIREVNLERYGDPLGPSFEHLVRKHTRDGVTDYRAIIEGASRTHGNVDALLGK